MSILIKNPNQNVKVTSVTGGQTGSTSAGISSSVSESGGQTGSTSASISSSVSGSVA